MQKLKTILEDSFNKWMCPYCNLTWWIGKDFNASRCPFRGCMTIYKLSGPSILSESAIETTLIQLPEDLSSDELANIFKIS